MTAGMMNSKTPAAAEQVWSAGRAGGKITMGTVIWFLRSRHGADCLRNPAVPQQGQLWGNARLARNMI